MSTVNSAAALELLQQGKGRLAPQVFWQLLPLLLQEAGHV